MRGTIALLAVVVAAAFASSALAAGNSSTSATYNTKGATVQKTVNKPVKKPGSKIKTAPKSNTRVRTGTLPFTGLDLGFIVAGGLVLVGTGVSLRRITRHTTPPTA